ncbi:hypothetical protein MBLNU230_g7057t1 [Neophaeotheca triangularis]
MAFLDVVKVVFLPALIALALYLLIVYALLPLYTRYRTRYEYLPVPQSLSATATTLRDRFWNSVNRLRRDNGGETGGGGGGDELAFGEEEGESMVGFDFGGRGYRTRERGGAYGVAGQGGQGRGLDSERRLSREVEEGFRDSSGEESEGEGGGTGGGRSRAR